MKQFLLILCLIAFHPTVSLGEEHLRNTPHDVLIEKLGSDRYIERRDAKRELKRRGDEVLPHLRQALKTSGDSSVHADVNEILAARPRAISLSNPEIYCLAVEELLKDQRTQFAFALTASAMASLSKGQRARLSKISEQINHTYRLLDELYRLRFTPENYKKVEELVAKNEAYVNQVIDVYRNVFSKLGAKLNGGDSNAVLNYKGMNFKFIYYHRTNEIAVVAEPLSLDLKRFKHSLATLGASGVRFHDSSPSVELDMRITAHPDRNSANVLSASLAYRLFGKGILTLDGPNPDCDEIALPANSPLPISPDV